MKLKYLFSAIIASVLLLVGCEQEPIGTFEDIKLSSTNVSIPAEGGEVSVTLTTTIDWAFVTTDFEWLTLDGPTSGGAGEYVLKFSAEAVSGGRDLTLEIKAGSHSQYITIRQGTKAVENATCADVIAGVDGKVYRVTGVCTSIANDLYGNWYLKDATGEVYVYGTLDKDGATKNFASWKMAPGDVVTVEGPRKDYNGTIELVDVTVLNIEKSLLKIEEQPEAITKEGGEYQLTLLYKGLGVQPSVPAVDADGESVDYREWISVVDVETKFAEATKLDPNPADTALVTIKVLPNEGGARNGIINFTSGTDEASSTVSFEFTQEGSIAEVTVADFLAKEKGDALYKLTGKVSGLKPGDYGNFHLVDATGSVYVYGLTATPVAKNDKSFPTLGIREGDIVTLIGKRDRYDDAKVPEEKEQVGGPAYYVSHIGSTDVTVAEFLQKPESSDVRYRITGTVANIQMDKNDPTKESAYGNFDLVDGDASVLVYGLTIAPVEKNDLSFPKLGLKAGDVVTIVGTRTAFKGTPQVGGPAYYITHTPGETPGEGGEGGEGGEEPSEKAARNLAFSSATATATLGEAFTAPTLSGETDGVVYTSSNTAVATVDAATGAVTLVAAGETTITATAAETETLQAGTASYTLTVSAAEVVEPEFEAGQYWIVANNLVAKPVTSSFGYLNVEDVWKSPSSVVSTQANAFTFTSVEGGYTIQDEAGKYYYGTVFNNAWSKNFNVSATLPAEGAIWKIVKNDDDTYTITNTTQPSYLQYSVSYKSFGHYTTAQTNAVLPTLVKVENAVPAVTLEASLTFEAEGGSQTITLPEGVTINPSSNNAAFTATASANVVTVSAAATTEAQSGVLTLVLNYNGFAITKTVDLTQKAAPVAGETVVLHETFDKCQNGDSFANNAANSSDTSIKTDVSGWTFVKGYEAYKSAKFGGSSVAGSATTPKLGVSGDMTVTFVATPWANDNTTLKLSVVGGGNLSVSTVTMKTSFSEHTVTITGATAETQLKFESNATKKCRFFLDDVKIVKK